MSTNTPPELARHAVRQHLWLETARALTHPQLPIINATDGANHVLRAYDAAFPAPEPLTVSND